MCQTSARFDVIILITIILTGLGDLKKIKKKKKFSWKIRIQHRLDKQNSLKKKCVLMKKTHAHADFL